MKTIFDLEIATLTPLHIWSSVDLEADYDYITYDGRTWVINQTQFANELYAEGGARLNQLLAGKEPATLLRKETEFDAGAARFRYVLRGRPRAGNVLKSFIKDAYDRPYLPGSSLKGALRTVVLRQAVEEEHYPLTIDKLGRNAKYAAAGIERDLLSTARRRDEQSPNYDLLRALQISDSAPLAVDKLCVRSTYVQGQAEGEGVPIPLELLEQSAVTTATLSIDRWLFEDAAAREKLRFGERARWLDDLPRAANEQSVALLDAQIAYCQAANLRDTEKVLQLLRREASGFLAQPDVRQFLLPVGWGTGWDTKTLSYLWPEKTREELIEFVQPKKHYRRGRPFPRSRRLVPIKKGEKPYRYPLGWLQITLRPRSTKEIA